MFKKENWEDYCIDWYCPVYEDIYKDYVGFDDVWDEIDYDRFQDNPEWIKEAGGSE